MSSVHQAVASSTDGANESRPVPAWLAIVVVVLAIAGAAWFVYSQFFAGPRLGQEVDIGTVVRAPSARNLFRVARPAAPVDGVRSIGPNYWQIRAGAFYMNLALQVNALAPLRLYYDKNDLVPPDEVQLMNARRQIVVNTQLANELKVTSDQIKKLADVPLSSGQGLALNEADTQRLNDEWQAWLKASAADKKPAEQKLVASLREIGPRSVAATRQQFSDRTAQIKSILTEEQIKQYRQRKG